MHGWNGYWYEHMGWMALWWVVGIVFVVALVRALLLANGPAGVRESPEQILKRRYASGEIDRETYQRMLTDLKSGGG